MPRRVTLLARIRSALFVAWMAITVVPIAIAVLLASIVLRGDRLYWMCVGFLRLSIWGAKAICGVRYRVHGMERLPSRESSSDRLAPVILCPKHQSTWETFAFPALMSHPLCYVFKRELIYIPFFGWAMGRLDMIHIDRSRRTEAWSKVAEQGREYMSRGHWVIMFPEGTRIARGERGSYKNGATRLAVATGVPVVPIAVNSAVCWPRRSFVLTPGTIDVSIGAPIPSVGREADELMREVEAWIEAEMRRIDPAAYTS
ncbi:MAG TPA: lysophospholipid acyltransferase family protein [Methylibium sp.]|uniref:lysophospholipid acyltransferase family protein n=1 Tax=Methylibium sp. TaxID=2067992 RepID=UPI002DC00833|nr:lysophospholipid acyltransferase family protein [Methylibium sp.]HEU4460906.1 lysophospholipid acyltransferase family protein [Methylibium sp.]